MPRSASAQMKKMSVECEVLECNFKTPTLDVEEYASMVCHLQVLRFDTLSQKLEEINQFKFSCTRNSSTGWRWQEKEVALAK